MIAGTPSFQLLMAAYQLKFCRKVLSRVIKGLLRFSADTVGILADASRAPQDRNVPANDLCGGELNFRTGRFDDGADAAGLYGRD